ncbi:MAG: LysE family translocator [Pseudomonadota bacterium]
MLEAYIVVLAGVILAQAAPGPNLIAVAGVALGTGRIHAIATAIGVSLAIFLWVALVSAGLATVLKLYPELLTVMKVGGGGYLLYLAFKGARAAWNGVRPSIKTDGSSYTLFSAFQKGFLVNITNPKSAMMWSSVATFLFGSGFSAVQVLLFAPLGALSALCIYGFYGYLFSSDMMRALYVKAARWFEAAFAAAFGTIGGKLFFDGLKEIEQ